MGAALHLAHAHQAPVKKRRPKRTGGGDGTKFAAIAHRIYQDERANDETRKLLLAFAYAVTMAPLDEDTGIWDAARKAVNASSYKGTLRALIREDVPRYEPPGYRHGSDRLDRVCRGPRIRPYPDPDDWRNTMNICGAPAQDRVLEKQLGTGWHVNHWFCRRHLDHLHRVREQVREQNAAAPDPIPNRGGLMPCYFDSDWLRVYRWAYDWDTWEPPVYGVRADDWPVPGKDPVPQRARLRLVVGSPDLQAPGGHE